MAHGTVGVIIECLTDNSNRTIHKLRELLNHHNARMTPVGYLFERKGLIRVVLDKGEEPELQLEKLVRYTWTSPVEDFTQRGQTDDSLEIEFICATHNLAEATKDITETDFFRELLSSELVYLPLAAQVPDAGEELTAKIANLVESLEENEDVLRVYTTLD